MKKIGYFIFNIFYYLFYLLPIQNKIFLLMTHDKSYEGNVLYTGKYFKSKDHGLNIKKLTKNDYDFKKKSILKLINFFIITPYHIARSKTILMDNIFLAFAYTKFKKNVSVVQLWHGTGTIKKFALDSEEGEVKKLAKKSNSRNTHLIIGSSEMFSIYRSAFDMENKNIFPIGTPRTDLFFDEKFMKSKINNFYEKYPELLNKKIILYAPTFRDDVLNVINNSQKKFESEKLYLNIEILDILKKLDNDYILALKLHPAISRNFSIKDLNIDKSLKKRVYDFSNINNDNYNENNNDITLNSLLLISEVLISDYSSVIFEYSLLNKKMIFYPYDIKEYEENSRGFYFDYENFVPGPIFYSAKGISEEIMKEMDEKNEYTIKKFKSKYMDKADGNSTERLYRILNLKVK